MRALDGVRAVAIVVVLAYHSGVAGFAHGGFYGQDIFFVLSGYLITSILLGEWGTRRGIGLIRFWGHRVRRLIPALVVMLTAVTVYVVVVAPAGGYPTYRSDALSTLFYYANWHFVATNSNYFVATGHPSLLTHTWSLSVEEQFYIIWPVALAGTFALTRVGRRNAAWITLVIGSACSLASAGWMAYLANEGASPSRMYYGTDTHCQCLLIGATTASMVALHRYSGGPSTLQIPISSKTLRVLAEVAAVVSIVLLLVIVNGVSSNSTFAFEGGFLCVGILAAVLIVATTVTPKVGVARLLESGPAVFVGRISYGMYLWFMPLFAVIDHDSTGLRGIDLFCVRSAADIAVATLSFFAVERPARRAFSIAGTRRRAHLRPLGAGFTCMAVTAAVIATAAPSAAPAVEVPIVLPTVGSTKILVVGDSTGATLAMALASVPQVDRRYGVSIESATLFGCGVVISAMIEEHGVPTRPSSGCDSTTPPDRQWPALIKQAVATTRPNVVVVVAGRWEVMNRKPSRTAPWTDILRRSDQQYVEGQLVEAIRVGSSEGARVDLTTAPCYSSGERPDGGGWPEDQYPRVVAYNRLVARAVATEPARASMVDLGQIVCPGGRFRQQVDGVPLRSSDGVHYPFFNIQHPNQADPDTQQEVKTFGDWIAPMLLPRILQGADVAGTAGAPT